MKNFTSKTQKIGELGESVSCRYLKKHGFNIIERNYTRKWGEIDIIAIKDNVLYFIEVKSQEVESSFFENKNEPIDGENFRPEENMHLKKIQRLRRVVETYFISQKIGNVDWRFDLLVVYIDIKNRKARVKVVENIIL